jgi:hypothetical protein
MTHLFETQLALQATGELGWWRAPLARLHLARCMRCRERAEVYKAGPTEVRRIAAELPPGLNWDRLANEMAANIHVGLAAGECVIPRKAPRRIPGLRLATAGVGLAALLAVAWWLNTPAQDTQSLGRALKAMAMRPFEGGLRSHLLTWDEQRSTVAVSAQGIELRENGTRLGVSQGTARPVAVTLSVKGAARARYVDAETGQVTITSVYAQ